MRSIDLERGRYDVVGDSLPELTTFLANTGQCTYLNITLNIKFMMLMYKIWHFGLILS